MLNIPILWYLAWQCKLENVMLTMWFCTGFIPCCTYNNPCHFYFHHYFWSYHKLSACTTSLLGYYKLANAAVIPLHTPQFLGFSTHHLSTARWNLGKGMANKPVWRERKLHQCVKTADIGTQLLLHTCNLHYSQEIWFSRWMIYMNFCAISCI